MRFVIAEDDVYLVTQKQEDDDVNLYINGEMFASLQEDGKLHLYREVQRVKGIQTDELGHILIVY